MSGCGGCPGTRLSKGRYGGVELVERNDHGSVFKFGRKAPSIPDHETQGKTLTGNYPACKKRIDSVGIGQDGSQMILHICTHEELRSRDPARPFTPTADACAQCSLRVLDS